MANPYIYATLQNSTINALRGRGSIMSDIDGTYYVSCAKHPDVRQPAVKVDMDKDVLSELEKAFDNCSGCIDEAHNATQWANTRFPEGSEI